MGSRPRRAVWLTNSSDLTLDAAACPLLMPVPFREKGSSRRELSELVDQQQRLMQELAPLIMAVNLDVTP